MERQRTASRPIVVHPCARAAARAPGVGDRVLAKTFPSDDDDRPRLHRAG